MPDEIPADSLYELSKVTSVDVSPDGRRVAFGVHEFLPDEEERHMAVFVAPTDGSGPAHRVTRTGEAWSPSWGPDGRRLAFLSIRDPDPTVRRRRADDESDGWTDRPQVWVADLERGGDPRQVTSRDHGVRQFDWGPDGDRLVVAARDPTDEQADYLESRADGDAPVRTERLQPKYMGHDWLDDVTTYLFVVDVDSGERRRLDEAYGGGAYEPELGLDPSWSPTGDAIAFLSNRTDDPENSFVMDAYAVSPDGGDPTRLTDGTVTASSLRWSPDGSRLAFVGGNPENWYEGEEVYVADLDAGTVRSVSASLDRSVSPYASTIAWVGDESVVVPFGDRGRTRLVRCYLDDRPPERVFEAQRDDESIEAFDAGGPTACLTLSSPDAPREVYALDAAALGESDPVNRRRLTALNRGFAASHPLPELRRLTVENADGDAIEALAYVPRGFDPDADDPRPLVAVVHGGPITYDAPVFDFDAAYWTARGYVVLKVNYRGSLSYGRAFSEQIRGEWGPMEARDVVAGVDDLVDRGWVDPDRLFVTGFSQGGVNTVHVVTRTDAFAAAAPEHGIYDFFSAYGTTDVRKWYEHDLGHPWENPDAYLSISSLTRIDELDTPLLVLAGGRDWRCPPTQAEELHVAARSVGVESRLVVYPDEHHNVGQPDRWIHRLEEITEWFETHDPTTGGDDPGAPT